MEVIFNQEKYPGFFAWIIPSNEGKGKVGVAGKGINVSETLNKILKERGSFQRLEKYLRRFGLKVQLRNL